MKAVFSLAIFLVASCGERPRPFQADALKFEFNGQSGAGLLGPLPSGIWIVMQTGASGMLKRIDMASGEESAVESPSVGPDVICFNDSVNLRLQAPSQVILASRGARESISWRNQKGAVTAERALPLGEISQVPFNPQFVQADPRGKVWVTGMGSNQVLVLGQGRANPVAKVSLSQLVDGTTIPGDGTDPFLEPGIIHYDPATDRMRVALSYLRQNYQGGHDWVPKEKAGMVEISATTHEALLFREIPVTNPVWVGDLHYPAPLPAETYGQWWVGGGSHNSHPLMANFWFEGLAPTALESKSLAEKIFTFDAWPNSDGAIIYAYTSQDSRSHESCLKVGPRSIHCLSVEEQKNGSYWGPVKVTPLGVVAGLARQGNGELWLVPLGQGNVQVLPLIGTVNSICLGP